MTDQNTALGKSAYLGLFFTALSTLMFEILLTRIFSATSWYHFAFMAVSVAMFGMTAGAIAVYLLPSLFKQERASRHLALSTTAFAIAIPLGFLGHLCVPFLESTTVVGVFSFVLTYTIISIPFFFSGIAICIALTKFPQRVSSLYAADLAGAGLGCIALLYTLEFTDGPSAVFVVAALAGIGALFFAFSAGEGRVVTLAGSTLVVLALAAIGCVNSAAEGDSWIKLVWVKGRKEQPQHFETWNSFSRITINPVALGEPTKALGWGIGGDCPEGEKVRQHVLLIDGTAGTVLTEFDGNTEPHRYLECDVTNLVHHLRSDAKMLAIGTGGGRDILSGIVFDQREIVGVEMNGEILRSANEVFGDFTGHLDQHPRTRFVNAEARSWVAGSDEEFDIVQISLIDTWAATSAGAFVLAENSLYTLEGWDLFLNHLSDRGVLSVSRWYHRDRPMEMHRTVALAHAALKNLGVERPAEHMAVLRSGFGKGGVGTLIAGREPLTLADHERIVEVAQRFAFEVSLLGDGGEDEVLVALASGLPAPPRADGLELDLSPPTDDRPFFFNMIRLRDLFRPEVRDSDALDANLKAVLILGVLLLIVIVLTFACVGLPLLWTTRRGELKGATPLLAFFGAIGFGFMLIELSQMHRLILFLGHPTYGLSVVLFAMLLSSGIGSFFSGRVSDVRNGGPKVFVALIATLVLFGLVTPPLLRACQSLETPVRIAIAVAVLFPLGLQMGMAFPLGLKLAAGRAARLTPWFWGVNGATSVCASVLSTAIALTFSISTAFWLGVLFYVVAWASFRSVARNSSEPDPQIGSA